ncbi:hypothetical protein P29A0810_115 [Synechococcus phage S-CAM8]|jgi:hypothetical protein|uniref:Uncharacterized protein n=1 Tax=Synechococcus phage S-CAM8 TaxID=754038 RepID=A0A1D8KN57_9CAUD|nr:hypothetical protein P29A0810_115 [Synechococcus phage S-CAM8]
MEDWKQRAYADPNLKWKHARLIQVGPKSLSQAWILGAMKFKYSFGDEFRNTTGSMED